MPTDPGEAARRIEQAGQHGHTRLDLSGLRLTSLPRELADLSDLTELDLSHNRIAELPDWLGELRGLTALRLSDNRFAHAPDLIGGLTGLTVLCLDDNRLTDLPDALAALTGLTRLELDGNRLTDVPQWLATCHGLAVLYLGRNHLLGVPDWLGALSELTGLGMTGCLLTEVPEWLLGLPRLTVLHLADNALTSLPDWVGELSSLSDLQISRNRLTTLPERLADLTSLTELYLYANRLTELPERLAALPKLEVLRLDNNEFTELPGWLGQLTSLTRLDLDGNRWTTLPESLANLVGLEELYLRNNAIKVLPDWIGEFTGLTRLDVASCELTDLPDSLAALSSLTVLDVSDNPLSTLPDWLPELNGLTQLRVQRCQLTELPDRLAKLGLTELEVDGNDIRELPEWIGDFGELTRLGIGSSALTTVPVWIARLPKLTELFLEDNQLTELPEWIADRSLVKLNLQDNQLTALPERLARLSGLTDLDLSRNPLSGLPEWIGRLQGLIWLHADECDLGVVPDSLTNLTGLTRLAMSGNRLTELPDDLANLPGLASLIVSRNQLAEVPVSIGELSGLRFLSLYSNQLTALPAELAQLTLLDTLLVGDNKFVDVPRCVSELRNLTELWLDDNQLTTPPVSLAGLRALRRLDVDGNRLTEVPDWIAGFTALAHLDVRRNSITKLPDWLTELPNLTEPWVADNPLVSPPPEIVVTGGSESVRAFLRARQQGSSELWVSKLLVVGEGGIGKTSLVKALRGLGYDAHESTTHGINIEQLELDHPERPDVRMRLSTWDFGGQQIYHATHQFFLTNRSLFLLLWNSRLGWEQGRLRYWLDVIQARAPESPVVLVATHTEGRPVDLPLEELRSEYPRIVASVSVENSTGDGVPELKDLLSRHATALPLMGKEWPTTWLAAADAVRAAPEKHVPPQRMFAMMAAAGVEDPTQQGYIAGALHELGDILYYADDEELNQTVVLAPQWANEYISMVLDSHEVAARKGLLSREHRNELWSDLDTGMRDHFLGMMDTYDLSYRIDGSPGGDVSLVVERLPWDPPEFPSDWHQLTGDGNSEIKVIYRLNTMPPGIPTWFIARSHRFNLNTHWRTGAMLRHTDGRHMALLRAQPHHKTVQLTVRGPVPTAFFSILDDGLNKTLERYPGLHITREIPCQCGESFQYEHLMRRLTSVPPRETIECHDCCEQMSVRELLLGLLPTDRESDREKLDQLKAMLERMDDKLTAQGEYSQRMFLKIQQMLQARQETRCPSVFTVIPANRAKRPKLLGARYELRLYCEEPGAWHPLPDGRGCYPVTEPVQWLRRFRPTMERLLKVLGHAAPLAAPLLGVAMDKVNEDIKANCELMSELISQLPAQLRYKDEAGDMPPAMDPAAHADADGDFRALEAMLLKLDPDREWGGLHRTATPEGLVLYLCEEHRARYRPGHS